MIFIYYIVTKAFLIRIQNVSRNLEKDLFFRKICINFIETDIPSYETA